MSSIKIFISLDDRAKTVFCFNSFPCFSSQLPAAYAPRVNQAHNDIGKSLWFTRWNHQTRIPDEIRAVSHIGYCARYAARHGLTDGVGETFSPGRSRTTDIESVVQSRDTRSLAQQGDAILKPILVEPFR